MGARISSQKQIQDLHQLQSYEDGDTAITGSNNTLPEPIEIHREGETNEELSVHFGYLFQGSSSSAHRLPVSPEETISVFESATGESSEETLSVSLKGEPWKQPRRNGSFTCLSGAAIGANATLANTSLGNGIFGVEILPGLDSPKTFRPMGSILRTSSLNTDSSISSTLSTLMSVRNQSYPSLMMAEESRLYRSTSALDSTSFLNAGDVQMAGGAAGEDRVQAVCSEEHGWLFCGVYDGFNGRDAADFLAGMLYENIGLHLRALEQRLHQEEANGEDRIDNDGSKSLESKFQQGVLDGLRDALLQTENDFLEMVENEMDERPDLVMVGSCVLVALIYGQNLYTLNLGDSRAVLATYKSRDQPTGAQPAAGAPLMALQLTELHGINVAVERERVVREHPDDPFVVTGGRLKGKLRVTRAVGAGYLKKANMNDALMGILRVQHLISPPYLTADPSVNMLRVDPDDQFVIIGSDGLFDFFTNDEVVNHIHQFLCDHPAGDPAKFMIDHLLLRVADNAGLTLDELRSIPIGRRRKYHDDITIVIVFLGSTFQTSSASAFS